jgi:hypothetical protein
MPEIMSGFRLIIVLAAVVAVTQTLAAVFWLPVYFCGNAVAIF